jgi:hypothetical protein
VRVPDNTEVTIEMQAENWGFGAVRGVPRDAQLSARPAGSEKPVVGS